MLGIGAGKYEAASEEYSTADTEVSAFLEAAENAGIDTAAISEARENGEEISAEELAAFEASAANVTGEAVFYDDDTGEVSETVPVNLALLKKHIRFQSQTRQITAFGFQVFRYLLNRVLQLSTAQTGFRSLFWTV